MKRLRRPLARLAALAAFAAFATGAAHAQAPGPGPFGPGAVPNDPGYASPDAAPADPVAYAQQNLASLRLRLNLTPAQAPAWNAFVDTVLHQSRDMQSMQAQMPQGTMTAPDRAARMAEMMKRGADDMAGMSRALRQLYAQLSPNQRAMVDQEFARAMQGGSQGAQQGTPPQGMAPRGY